MQNLNMAPTRTTELLAALRKLMVNANHVSQRLGAYIVPLEDAHQSEYIAPCDKRVAFISGFTGSRGEVAVCKDGAAMWTDGRYFVQARNEMDDNWTLMREGVKGTPTLEEFLVDNVEEGGFVGIDPRMISADRFRKLRKSLKAREITLMAVGENLVDLVWADYSKPAMPSSPLQVLPVAYSGRTWQVKVEAVRGAMRTGNAKLLVVSALDEIAWLFNLRGNDIPYNPVFFAYAIIGLDFVSLFIDDSKLTDEIASHLNCGPMQQNGNAPDPVVNLSVEVHPYTAIGDHLAKYCKECLVGSSEKVWLPMESTNHATASVVDKTHRFTNTSPIAKMKAVKNETEIAGMKNAHLKDAVAHCEFLVWLGDQMKRANNAHLTEQICADTFEKLRAAQTDYVSPSFDTISAAGAHAASPHYHLTSESNAQLSRKQVYLVDSGAQYRDGTTDVTRTVCFEDPTPYQKQCFTLVLKGHIALAKQCFPEGVNGMRLDTLSRADLWNVGLDFRHGTGHGVGHFLNVHEGPAGIGFRLASHATEGIYEHMIMTIEPGYYEDGEFGIRIENVYAVVEANTKHHFPNTRFMTFEPLTLVPIQRKFLDPALMTADEISWLNNYHQQCVAKVGPVLEAQGKWEIVKWLQEQCKPLD